MTHVIQQVPFGDDRNLFIIGFNEDTNMLTFRFASNPHYNITQEIRIEGDMVFTEDYHFPMYFLQKFIDMNTNTDAQ